MERTGDLKPGMLLYAPEDFEALDLSTTASPSCRSA